jgi:hypothetical protein
MLRYMGTGLAVAVLVAGCGTDAQGQGAKHSSACGPSTIAFRAPPAHERRFTCGEGSWYDGGYRLYLARLRAPVGALPVTLTLIHMQAGYNDERGGKLLTEVVPVRNPKAWILTGKLDFSSVYGTSGPAGAPPFGRYTLTIHRGVTERGQVLARGTFTVIED